MGSGVTPGAFLGLPWFPVTVAFKAEGPPNESLCLGPQTPRAGL